MEQIDITTDGSRDGLYGVYIGIVADVDDPRNNRETARVRVTFPWRSSNDMSNWAPIVTDMGGANSGLYCLPEKGDLVLVAFGSGDITAPYVLGTVWNGEQPPPVKKDPENNTTLIRTKAGHELEFNNAKGKGRVSLSTKQGKEVVLDDGNDTVELTDGNGNKIKMSEDGIEISSDGTISLSGQEVKTEAEQGLNLKAKQLTANGTAETSISSGGSLGLEASGPGQLRANGRLLVKGSGITQVQGSRVLINCLPGL